MEKEEMDMIKKLWAIGILCGCFLLCGCQNSREQWVVPEKEQVLAPETEQEIISQEVKEDISTQTIWVYVCGEVVRPGVYLFVQGDRVFQALEAAGGMTADANVSYVNQARMLADGEQIYVPSSAKEESALFHDAQILEDNQNTKININTASIEELITISGIGNSRAQAIIDYRREYGQFQSIQDIMQVPGIKEGLFEKIKEKIKVG